MIAYPHLFTSTSLRTQVGSDYFFYNSYKCKWKKIHVPDILKFVIDFIEQLMNKTTHFGKIFY